MPAGHAPVSADGQRVIFVMTHDSIGLGEDGPTHQPVEHVAALRAMPEPQRLPPGRRHRNAECWQLALENKRPRQCWR
jgi:transketolase